MSASNLTAAIRRQLMKDAVVLQGGGNNNNNNNNIYSPLENPSATTIKQPPKEKTLQCSLCPKRFASAPALSRHRREQHKLPPKKFYVCPLCKSSARNKAFYREHLLSEHQTTLDDEKLTFDSYNDFTRWKERIEATTKSYYIRSHIVNTDHRYDEYYGCHRSGSRHAKPSSALKTPEKEGSNHRKQSPSKTSVNGLKIGGLCPATIKLHYSERAKHFEVQHCRTHIGHLLDTEVRVQRRSSSRSSTSSSSSTAASKKPPKINSSNKKDLSSPAKQTKKPQQQQKTSTSTLEGQVERVEEGAPTTTTSLAIDSIILSCAYGCPEVPVCEHLKPFQVVEEEGGHHHHHSHHQLQNHPVDHHYYHHHHQVPSTESCPQPSTTNLIPPHPNNDPSTSTSITPNTTSNEEEEMVIVEEAVVDLTDMATLETLFLSSNQTVQFTSSASQAETSPPATIKIADFLEQPALTLLFGSLLQRTNSRNYEYVRRKLQEVLGTLDSLELIHGSYSRPPEEEEEKEEEE